MAFSFKWHFDHIGEPFVTADSLLNFDASFLSLVVCSNPFLKSSWDRTLGHGLMCRQESTTKLALSAADRDSTTCLVLLKASVFSKSTVL